MLHLDGIPASTLAERFGTPLYVYEEASIRRAFARLKTAFSFAPFRLHYAMKANSNPWILRLLHQEGVGGRGGRVAPQQANRLALRLSRCLHQAHRPSSSGAPPAAARAGHTQPRPSPHLQQRLLLPRRLRAVRLVLQLGQPAVQAGGLGLREHIDLVHLRAQGGSGCGWRSGWGGGGHGRVLPVVCGGAMQRQREGVCSEGAAKPARDTLCSSKRSRMPGAPCRLPGARPGGAPVPNVRRPAPTSASSCLKKVSSARSRCAARRCTVRLVVRGEQDREGSSGGEGGQPWVSRWGVRRQAAARRSNGSGGSCVGPAVGNGTPPRSLLLE